MKGREVVITFNMKGARWYVRIGRDWPINNLGWDFLEISNPTNDCCLLYSNLIHDQSFDIFHIALMRLFRHSHELQLENGARYTVVGLHVVDVVHTDTHYHRPSQLNVYPMSSTPVCVCVCVCVCVVSMSVRVLRQLTFDTVHRRRSQHWCDQQQTSVDKWESVEPHQSRCTSPNSCSTYYS